MFQIPFQRCQEVDFNNVSNSFRSLLQTVQSELSSIDESDLVLLNEIRSKAVSSTGPTDESRQSILRYHYHVSNLAPRLRGYENDMKLLFCWSGGIAPEASIRTTCIFTDWACFLWNLAALESLGGCSSSRDTDDGSRVSCRHFQQAAGIFEFIRESVLPHITGPRNASISRAGLEFAKNIMLGQAQLCFYEKALRDRRQGRMQAATIAKVSCQVSAFFTSAMQCATDSELQNCLEAVCKNNTEYNAYLFAGLTH